MIMGILTAIIMALWLLPAYFKAPKEYRLDKKYIIKGTFRKIASENA